jgi:hypothetical protein
MIIYLYVRIYYIAIERRGRLCDLIDGKEAYLANNIGNHSYSGFTRLENHC